MHSVSNRRDRCKGQSPAPDDGLNEVSARPRRVCSYRSASDQVGTLRPTKRIAAGDVGHASPPVRPSDGSMAARRHAKQDSAQMTDRPEYALNSVALLTGVGPHKRRV